MNINNILLKLLSINSETGKELEISNYIGDLLIKNEFIVIKQKVSENRYNIFAYPRSCDPNDIKLLFSGHMDTVPIGSNWTSNPYGEIKDEMIYGRGSVDMKAGVASIICAGLKTIHNKFLFVFTVGEEVNMIGVREFLKDINKFPNLQYFIVAEPTYMQPLIDHKGGISMEVTAHGKSVHASIQGEEK